MNRAVVMSAALSLVAAGAVSAQAAPKDRANASRTVTVTYDGPAAYYAACVDCPDVPARANEHYVTVEVIDDLTRSAHVDIAWDVADGPGHGFFVVCGRTAKPQRIPAGAQLTVYPWAHPGPECPGSASTKGKVKLTFSARP
jgi:hypothetical protein